MTIRTLAISCLMALQSQYPICCPPVPSKSVEQDTETGPGSEDFLYFNRAARWPLFSELRSIQAAEIEESIRNLHLYPFEGLWAGRLLVSIEL